VIATSQIDGKQALPRTLKWFDVAMLGVSLSVGAGIFSVGAKVIVNEAGPASIISFIIAAAVCMLAVMCYAEFSTVIPVAGSSYSFSYVSLGEIFAWIIGWNVILELFMASSVIIKYWSVYLHSALRSIGIIIPGAFSLGSITVDWPIFIGITIFVAMLIFGTKFSARTAGLFVLLKVCVILFIVIMGLQYFDFSNLTPFIPDSQPAELVSNSGQSLFSFLLGQQPAHFGIMGIFSGAAIIFFAFIGFDAAASVAEETVNPKKNMPLGLFAGISIVSLLYVLVAIVTAGMSSRADFQAFQSAHPDETISIITAFEIKGNYGVEAIASFGAFLGLTTVVLIAMMGLARVVLAMSRDGLLPKSLSVVSKRGTPVRIQILAGILIAIVAAFTNIEELDEMINIGTLSAFVLVSFAIPILRKKGGKSSENSFKVPFSPVLPIISGLICIWLAINLSIGTWSMFIIWIAIGLVIYFTYSIKHSMLAKYSNNFSTQK
jgi:APA family basic amino acid/polyamine antiporter